MNKAAFDEIEALTNNITTFLMELLHLSVDLAVRHAIIAKVNELNELLDKARHQHKGGPR